MAISFGHPDIREFHFKRKHLKFEIDILIVDKNGLRFFVYICKKLEGADEVAKLHWDEVLE